MSDNGQVVELLYLYDFIVDLLHVNIFDLIFCFEFAYFFKHFRANYVWLIFEICSCACMIRFQAEYNENHVISFSIPRHLFFW